MTASSDTALVPPRPLAPLGGAIVDASAPTFSWASVPGATAYEVQVSPSRQFAQSVLEFEAGPSTEVALFKPLPVGGSPWFWRVRARTPQGTTLWSSYGRFAPGTDDAVDAFRSKAEAEQAAAKKAYLKQLQDEDAERALVPAWQRDDAAPKDREYAALGLTLVFSFILTILLIVFVTLL